MAQEERRPISMRYNPMIVGASKWLAQIGITPNQVSLASIFLAALAAAIMAGIPTIEANSLKALMLVVTLILFLGRALCNLIDGLIAVEGGKKTKSGIIFNEFPDRFADLFIFIGAGYLLVDIPNGIILGYVVGIVALLTAYIRALGSANGTPPYFEGPMAKPHRMGIISLGIIGNIAEIIISGTNYSVLVALCIIVVGGLITFFRRLIKIIYYLEKQ